MIRRGRHFKPASQVATHTGIRNPWERPKLRYKTTSSDGQGAAAWASGALTLVGEAIVSSHPFPRRLKSALPREVPSIGRRSRRGDGQPEEELGLVCTGNAEDALPAAAGVGNRLPMGQVIAPLRAVDHAN